MLQQTRKSRVNWTQADGRTQPTGKPKHEIAMYNQTEYGLAYALIFGLLTLGLIVVCIPRPRKKDLYEIGRAHV